MKMVALGLHNHHTNRGYLPSHTEHDANGTPLNSWRFQLIPYMEQLGEVMGPLWSAGRKLPWNAPQNKPFADMPYYPYTFDKNDNDLTTHIFAVIGPGTLFDPKSYDSRAPLQGTVIALLEVADSKTHWMQPGDYDVTPLLAASGKLGDHVKSILPHRIHVAFADFEIWTLSDDTPMDAVKPFLTIAGAKRADREKTLGPYRVD